MFSKININLLQASTNFLIKFSGDYLDTNILFQYNGLSGFTCIHCDDNRVT